MASIHRDLLHKNSVFAWIGILAGLLLLIPLIAMQVTTEVRWSAADFLVMGSALFGFASLFVLAARRTPPRYRWLVGSGVAVAFLYLWAELAVGVFTTVGS